MVPIIWFPPGPVAREPSAHLPVLYLFRSVIPTESDTTFGIMTSVGATSSSPIPKLAEGRMSITSIIDWHKHIGVIYSSMYSASLSLPLRSESHFRCQMTCQISSHISMNSSGGKTGNSKSRCCTHGRNVIYITEGMDK